MAWVKLRSLIFLFPKGFSMLGLIEPKSHFYVHTVTYINVYY